MDAARIYPIDAVSRRRFLFRGASGLGSLALGALLAQDGAPTAAAAELSSSDPLAPKRPHFPPKAKSVIWLFMEGGPSHIDLFDPKPALVRYGGHPMPASFGHVTSAMGTDGNPLMASTRTWKQHGQSGVWVSDLLPNLATHVDEMAVLRSCWADHLNHVNAVCQMNTGATLAGRPALGCWITYGLGAANQDLPAFVVLIDDKPVTGDANNWSAGFLPATYQGTLLRRNGPPILDLVSPKTIGIEQQRSKLALLAELDRIYGAGKPQMSGDLEAHIRAYELAFRMQSAAPEVMDLSKEPASTRELYGINDEMCATFGTNCLLARRLVERGVRFVELYCGSGSAWDAHTKVDENHVKMCRISDRPIAGLLTDLKARGLLDSTLVVWGGEFGRTPFSQNDRGRDHNPWGFTMWMAGGGIKGGQTVGTTDEIGLRAVEKPYHVLDLHATILHQMGLNHVNVVYFHNGRAERPTITAGKLIKEVV